MLFLSCYYFFKILKFENLELYWNQHWKAELVNFYTGMYSKVCELQSAFVANVLYIWYDV